MMTHKTNNAWRQTTIHSDYCSENNKTNNARNLMLWVGKDYLSELNTITLLPRLFSISRFLQIMNHIADMFPLTKSEGGLQSLYNVEDNVHN